LTLLAYHGTATDPIAGFASASETVTTASHVTPQVSSPGAAWLLSYWADNTSATTAWTPPTGQAVRSTSFGTGGGRITSLVTDSADVVPIGPQGGLTATANSSTAKATMWTVLLAD
jgi:hypothetical protein